MENHYHAYALEVLGDGRKAWVMLPGDYRLAKTAWNNGKKGAAKVAKDGGEPAADPDAEDEADVEAEPAAPPPSE